MPFQFSISKNKLSRKARNGRFFLFSIIIIKIFSQITFIHLSKNLYPVVSK